jgi:hypothetical protein
MENITMQEAILKVVEDKKEKIDLREAQEIIGGYVEVVRLPKGLGKLLVDEEGLLKGLPLNIGASLIAGRTIMGNAIYFASGCGRNW